MKWNKKSRRYREKHARRRRTRVWPVVLAAVIITLVALAFVYGGDIARYFKARDTQQELQDLYKGAAPGNIWDLVLPRAYAEEAELPTVPPDEVTIHEDFAALYEKNPHLTAWLTAGESIDYPVVQSDNTFYLDHDYFGNEDINGTLFINAANRLDPRDGVLLIHGHNMKSGAMFGDMDKFRDFDYLRKYPIVTFRTIWDEEDVLYVPVAAFDASMNPEAKGYFDITRIRFKYDIPGDETSAARSTALEEYIAQMREMSFWNSPVEADSTDDYIALITCSYNHDDGRLIMLCRKLRSDETAESIQQLFAK